MRGRVAALMVVAACTHPHAHFEPPSATIAPNERVDLFMRRHATVEETRTCDGQRCGGHSEDRSVFLADGTHVFHESDLLPLVADDSATARHSAAADRAKSTTTKWGLVAAAGFVTAFGLFASSVDDQDGSPGWKKGLMLTGAIVGVIGGVMAWKSQYTMWDETNAAFHSYNADLGTRLNVCADGLNVVPCEGGGTSRVPTDDEPPRR
ncbi:MAG TPA: hypothetical protein VGM90_12825 [Kofleriaceae bacterium]|jgi:hypothetical protein